MLLLVRVSIAAVSGSLSIIVTTLDAVLDVISGFIIWSTSLARQRRNKYKFPIGQVSAAHDANMTNSTMSTNNGHRVASQVLLTVHVPCCQSWL